MAYLDSRAVVIVKWVSATNTKPNRYSVKIPQILDSTKLYSAERLMNDPLAPESLLHRAQYFAELRIKELGLRWTIAAHTTARGNSTDGIPVVGFSTACSQVTT
jgi:hypothetical protein